MASEPDEHQADDESKGNPDRHPPVDPSLTKPVGPFAAGRHRDRQGAESAPQRDSSATVRLGADIFASPTDPVRASAPDASISCPKGDETLPPETPPSATPPSGTDEEKPILAPGSIQPGQTLFGRYHVERQLGEGGMGTVWLVRHLELDSLRALKLIIPGIAFDPVARARFKREARLMARLAHPNAVTVHDARMSADAAFIEMEFIAGGNLSSRLESGVPMPLAWITRILDQLCDVVHAAHELGIVHRDLKPANLMLVEGRTPGRDVLKVTDFGIAKIFDPERRTQEDVVTRSGGASFTPHYASPEQISGSELDGRSDIYAIGVILYELLAGRRPFGGNGILYNHLCTPPPPLAEANPRAEVPPAVEQVVMRCLAKDPGQRPQTAHQLAEAFHQALAASGRAGAPVATHRFTTLRGTEPATATPGAGWLRRAFLVGVPLLILALLGVASRSFWPRKPQPEGPRLPAGYEAAPGVEQVGGWPRAIVRKSDGARFLRLEGGTYLMGDDTPEATPGSKGRRDERPAHPVKLSDFYIQETEVTNAQMEAYFRARGIEPSARPKRWLEAVEELATTTGKPDHYPAVGIPYQVADDHARWAGGLLPTEAQWEYAARSGGQPRSNVWGNDPWKPGVAILAQHGEGEHAEVVGESRDRTEQGVADMAGNVREWCRDVYAPYASSPEPVPDPYNAEKPEGPAEHVVRGGSYRTFPDAGRTTGPRHPTDHDGSYTVEQLARDGAADDLGFRAVIEWPPR